MTPQRAGGELLPFEQQVAESARAYASFVIYRDLGPQRSLETVRQKVGKSKALIERWSTQHGWVDRVRSYDVAMDARARKDAEKAAVKRRRQMLQEHADEARGLRKIAGQLITEFQRRFDGRGTLQWIDGQDFIKMVGQLPKIIETAQQLERLATGELPTNLEPPKPPENMSPDELAAYIALLESAL